MVNLFFIAKCNQQELPYKLTIKYYSFAGEQSHTLALQQTNAIINQHMTTQPLILPDARKCAQKAPDEYVVKIVAEAAQLLICSMRILHGEPLSRADKNNCDIEATYHSNWCPDLMCYLHQRWDEMGLTYMEEKHQRPIRMSHQNHPMRIWVSSSIQHFIWTCDYALALIDEHQSRPLSNGTMGANHRYRPIFEWLKSHPPHPDLFPVYNYIPVQHNLLVPSSYLWMDPPKCMNNAEFWQQNNIIAKNYIQAYKCWVRFKYHNIKVNKRGKQYRQVDWKRSPQRRPKFVS